MCPAVANQCHGSTILLCEMHQTINIMKHFSTVTSLSIKGLTFVMTQWDHNVLRVLTSCILGNQKKRSFLVPTRIAECDRAQEDVSKGIKETCCMLV